MRIAGRWYGCGRARGLRRSSRGETWLVAAAARPRGCAGPAPRRRRPDRWPDALLPGERSRSTSCRGDRRGFDSHVASIEDEVIGARFPARPGVRAPPCRRCCVEGGDAHSISTSTRERGPCVSCMLQREHGRGRSRGTGEGSRRVCCGLPTPMVRPGRSRRRPLARSSRAMRARAADRGSFVRTAPDGAQVRRGRRACFLAQRARFAEVPSDAPRSVGCS